MTDRLTRHADLAERYLPDELLERFRARAAGYDLENRFFDEDLAELVERGYLHLFVPERHGGPGLSLDEVSHLQQRLATAAPATALAVNMHLMCTGVAKAMADRGDHSLDGIFAEAMAGEIFAFGISEPSNDWVIQDSRTVAVPQDDGGYLLSGVKIFTSLSPVWTRLIAHGRDGTDPESPALVYGFLERDAPGITVSDRWDVMGMRASQSRATILQDVRMKPERVNRRIAVGRVPDLLTFAITSNFQLLIGSVYAGVARRALDLGAAGLKARRSAKAGATLRRSAGVPHPARRRAPRVPGGARAAGGLLPRLRRARRPRSALASAARERPDHRLERRPPRCGDGADVHGRRGLRHRPRAEPAVPRCHGRPVPPAERRRGPPDVRRRPAGRLTDTRLFLPKCRFRTWEVAVRQK